MLLRWNALRRRLIGVSLLTALICSALPPSLRGQTEKKTEPNVQQPLDKGKLELRYGKEYKQIIEDLTKGKAAAKDNADAVDVLAQWHTYRVTWPENQSITGAISGGRGVFTELDIFLGEAAKNKPATAPLLEMFSARVAEHMKTVLQNDRAIARVNGARILARIAEAGQEEVADLLAETVKDPRQLDGVKYYAFMGLRELFAHAGRQNATVFQSKTGKEREVRCLAVVGERINRKLTIPDDLPHDEKEGLRMVQGEAVRALALNRRPAITDDKGVIVDSPALTLLRVARADGLTPEPRFDARVDAAAGVARMSPKAFEGYQPDYAAYQLAWFVADFAQATNTDKKVPWKVEAAKLADAVNVMKTETAKLKEGKFVGEVADRCLQLLGKIELSGSGNAAELAAWLNNNTPVNASLFRGVTDSVIREGGKELPGKPAEKVAPAKPPEPDKK
jgi:hypothetical protein